MFTLCVPCKALLPNFFQAILELNVTEVSHSQDHVGAEVFAEPYSFICLLGTKLEESSQQSSSQDDDVDTTDQLSFQQVI